MYDKPLTVTYGLGNIDFGAADDTYVVKGPAGATGVLRAILFSTTEIFAGSTSTALFRVGTAADPDAYSEYDLGTTAADTAVEVPDSGIFERSLPADTDVHFDIVAAVGTPTGQAQVWVVIDWNAENPRMSNG